MTSKIDEQSLSSEQQTFNEIEKCIQEQYNVTIPALVFEYIKKMGDHTSNSWDYNDLFEFFFSFWRN